MKSNKKQQGGGIEEKNWLIKTADWNQFIMPTPLIPLKIMGRVRKDGKLDRRYTNGYLMQQEYLDELAGIHPSTIGSSK